MSDAVMIALIAALALTAMVAIVFGRRIVYSDPRRTLTVGEAEHEADAIPTNGTPHP